MGAIYIRPTTVNFSRNPELFFAYPFFYFHYQGSDYTYSYQRPRDYFQRDFDRLVICGSYQLYRFNRLLFETKNTCSRNTSGVRCTYIKIGFLTVPIRYFCCNPNLRKILPAVNPQTLATPADIHSQTQIGHPV